MKDNGIKLTGWGYLLLFISSALLAQQWQPYQFSGNEKYEFKIKSQQGRKPVDAYYALDIKSSGKQDSNGEDLFEITYTTRGTIPKSELGAQTAFGFWSVYGMSLSMAFLNPMYSVFFSQMNLAVGEKMSFFGAGMLKVTGEETIGGRRGYVCKFYQKDENGEALVTEWTVDPSLAFPIKSILYDKGEVQSHIELVRYTKY